MPGPYRAALGQMLPVLQPPGGMPHAAEGPRSRLFNGLPRKAGGGVKTLPYGLTFTGAL